jgi:hypothetical protein
MRYDKSTKRDKRKVSGTSARCCSIKASRHALYVEERLCGIWAGQEADVVRTSLLLSSSFLAQGSEHNRGCESQLHGSEMVVTGSSKRARLCFMMFGET